MSQLMCSHVYLVYGRVTRVSSARPRVGRRGGGRALAAKTRRKCTFKLYNPTKADGDAESETGSPRARKELSAFYRTKAERTPE